MSQSSVDDVFQRHIGDGDGDQSFDERGEPEEVRHEAKGGGDQRNRMPDGERCDNDDKRPQPPGRRKRNAVATWRANRSTRGRMANSEVSDWIGYSSRTSSNC